MDDPAASQSAPVYHEVSPLMLWARRIFSGITIIMIALALLFCLIRGKGDWTFYLLFVNILISCVILSFLLWWYRKGDLVADRFWFIVLVAGVIIFQCLTTDIFVFQHVGEQREAQTTIIPHTISSPNVTAKAMKSLLQGVTRVTAASHSAADRPVG